MVLTVDGCINSYLEFNESGGEGGGVHKVEWSGEMQECQERRENVLTFAQLEDSC